MPTDTQIAMRTVGFGKSCGPVLAEITPGCRPKRHW
jgi:hypothetical protein